MGNVDTNLIKEAVIKFLRNNGPSLPVPISKYLEIDTLFTSAFLSELLSEQKIKISSMRVGTSPIYYVPGTEKGLEKYKEHLKSKEKEAYERLKENNFLEDEHEHPAIRVALREIKDFAKSFEKNGKIIWRYYLISESDYGKEIIEKQEEIKERPKHIPSSIMSDVEKTLSQNEENLEKEEIEIKPEQIKEIHKKEIKEKKEEPIKELERINKENEVTFVNPLAKKPEPKKKEKSKSEFVLNVIEFIEKNNWKIIEETDFKAKEYDCLVEVNSDLGPIIFFTQARDKKTINEADLSKILTEAQSIPLPALILGTGEVQKKANEFLEKYKSILKFKKIE